MEISDKLIVTFDGDDPRRFFGNTSHDPFVIGNLAPTIPNAFVNGEIYARVSQNPFDDDTPASTSVNADQQFVIDLYWKLNGQLISAIRGDWAVTVFFDSMGPNEYDFQIVGNSKVPYGCPDDTSDTNRSTRFYHARCTCPADIVKTEPNGTSYELTISLDLLDDCHNLSTEIFGRVPLEDIYFFRY